MFHAKIVFLLIILISVLIKGYCQNTKEYECFSVKNSKREIREFLYKRYGFDRRDFESGDVIADVGAGNGYVSGMIFTMHNEITFYIQDIDSSCCNKEEVKKVFDHYSKLKGNNDSNYEIVIGNSIYSCLPEDKFDKIIMCSVFHFLPDPYIYFKDLKTKLKDDGKLFIINFYTEDENERGTLTDGENVHYEPLLKEIVEPIEKAGFKLIELRENNHSSFNKLVFVIKN